MGISEARANVEKNRLYMKISGFFTDEEAKETADRSIAAMKKLKPGFDIITDGSELKALTPQGTNDIERVMKIAAELGVGRTVRVVGDKVSVMQLRRKEREAGAHEAPIASSIEEADRMLDNHH
ncbi:MAG: hypothetical protein PHV74_14820 [Dehalococcoidia bacterium]|nr:hypothetical protein [Dehalococcoidia bacterium]